MPSFPLQQVDAFTDHPLRGNPCAVVFEAGTLDDTMMLAVAREMNLSETAFVVPSRVADFGARYFTPAEEIPMAGHPTIATVFALIDSGRLKLAGDITRITLELRAGVIPVEIRAANGMVGQIIMSQRKPRFLSRLDPHVVMPVFGLAPDDVLHGAPVQIVSTGTPQLMIPVKSPDVLRAARVNLPAYSALRAEAGFFSPHLFCLQGATSLGRTFARHFGVPPDTMEDPFTGSATGGMAAYLWHHRLIGSPVFIAEQGHWMNRPGHAYVEIVGTPDDIETVKVGGNAVTVLRGTLTTS